ncbi:MAG TPA: hypothetical protein VFP44_15205, partial [Usitatibacter sp.]|nr:hypothetical protein [Usitatibacter sp.]
MGDTITFVVPGRVRAAGAAQSMTATVGRDVVRLTIANGPTLTLHPETARDLLLAQSGSDAAPRGAGIPVAPEAVQVPPQLRWKGLDQAAEARGARGLIGDVLLSGFEILGGGHPADELAAEKIVAHFDQSVKPGVYRLDAASLEALDPATTPRVDAIDADVAKQGPLLVLVHGTFSSTKGTFDKLWQEHPQLVRELFAHYGDRVFALEHATLGASPAANALALAHALPAHGTVHLLTHSRGGLVAEVLARACAARGFTAEDAACFPGAEYEKERAILAELADIARERQLEVGRVVRVACPARGTLLASRRLDAYLSVLQWALELAHVPVAPELVAFLGKVAQRRTDPKEIPGLAAQIPDSPLVRWLHAAPAPIAGDLRVVAGDMEGDSIATWVKTLLADAYYWMDNDLVVQTRSMYGGAPRASGATFVLDRGGKVSHFSYFANEVTANAIVAALKEEAPPVEFRAIGPLSWQGRDDSGVRAAPEIDAGDKPAVVLLPGILGSNLAVDGKRVWLDWRIVNGLERLRYDPAQPGRVTPDGPIEDTYAALAAHLARTHHVIELAYDWRIPMERSAQLLADAIVDALSARERTGQPVRILAHSMGGLVARTLQLEQPEVWARMMANAGARVVMLGTPNAGSWAPMQVLSGDDDFGNMLSIVGMPFHEHASRELIAQFPGFLQLQAGLTDQGLGDRQRWSDLAAQDVRAVEDYNWWHNDALQLQVYRWGVPSQDALARAVALQRRLDAQRDPLLAQFARRMALVVGRSGFTPAGYEMTPQGLVYVNARDGGDGRVPLGSALLPGVPAWKLDCGHGDLPRQEAAFDAYVDLLERGDTDKLEPLVATRGTLPPEGPVVRSRARPSRSISVPRPPQRPADVLGVERSTSVAGARNAGPRLQVTIQNGDIRFAGRPLMLGHYRASRLTGSERAMDERLGGTMAASL